MNHPPQASQVKNWSRIIVTGCRYSYWIETARRAVDVLSKRHDGLVIVHGGCPGIDTAFADACRELRIATDLHPARWDDLSHPNARIKTRADGTAYNAAAGPIRNQAMVDSGAIMCLAFHPDLFRSKGTKDCVVRALSANIPTWWKSGDNASEKPRLLELSDDAVQFRVNQK